MAEGTARPAASHGKAQREEARPAAGQGDDAAHQHVAESADEGPELVQLASALRGIDEELKQANALVKEFQELMHKSVELQDKVKTISLRTKRDLSGLDRSVRKLRLSDSQEASDLVGALNTLKRRAVRLRETQPETRSIFSRIVLGRVNVKCFSERERFRLRDEYNKFKLRTSVIFVLFPLVVLFFHYYLRHNWADTHWINLFHHLWLLYYFVSLALRENILLVNGSNIRPWWIYHHYLSAAGTVVWLVWPQTEIYLSYVPYVTCLCLYTGVVQSMQILFYQKRDYANRALGKTGHMDISYPETLTELPKELLILVPFLFIAQVWQMLLGLSFLKTFFFECDILDKHWTEFREELQVGASGVFAIILASGNFIATVLTVYRKANQKQSMLALKEEREQLSRVLDHKVKAS